jgi:hypothetical protein
MRYPIKRAVRLHLGPARGIWEDQDTHAFGKSRRVFGDRDYDLYDPFKSLEVEMFARPAFIEPINLATLQGERP